MRARTSHRSRAVFFRSLALMARVGIPFHEALRFAGAQAEEPHLKEVVEGMVARVSTGYAFSSGLEAHPDIFPAIHRELFVLAEATGKLPNALERVAEYEEKAHHTALKLKSALTYPLWILLACFIFMVFIPPWLFRGLLHTLRTSGVHLPLLTRLLMVGSNLLASPWFYLVVVLLVAGLGLAARHSWQDAATRRWLTDAAMAARGIGPVVQAVATSRFARSLQMVMEVGVPILEGLPMAAAASGNDCLVHRSRLVVASLIDGASLDEALQDIDFFPRSFIDAVRVGQAAGELPRMLSKLADLFDTELEYRSGVLLAALEPLAMLFMGVLVGGTIIATMSPLLSLVRTL